MSSILNDLADENRVLFTVKLNPVQGSRFQPTGFPDLGAATYQSGNISCLLVESAQSMANRMEMTIWNEVEKRPMDQFKNLSHVIVESDKKFLTDSILEAHRLNSVYIEKSKNEDDTSFKEKLANEIEYFQDKPVNKKLFYKTILKYDVNCLLHGIFLESIGGRLRIPRSLSAFIEAENVNVAASGGVKFDHIEPGDDSKERTSSENYGNIPFPREEYTADVIKAYFSIDLSQIQGYGLGTDVETMLTLLALYKIRALIDGSLRLRTACDLEIDSASISACRPAGFKLPTLSAITESLESAISSCKKSMDVTTVNYTK